MITPQPRLSEPTRSGGGRDNITGTNLQHLITAWGMVLMLAEQAATPPFRWPSTSTITLIRSETEQAVDDVMIGNSAGGFGFVQAKASVQLTARQDLPLDKSVAQFCRQLHSGSITSPYPWQRPFRPDLDRFILATTDEAASTVTRDLRAVLRQVRAAGPDVPLTDCTFNKGEVAALRTLNTLVDRHWQTLEGRLPTDDERLTLLQLIHVQVFDFTEGGTHLNESLTLLRSHVLASPQDAEAAWAGLLAFAATHGELSGGVGIEGVRHELRRLGYPLVGPPSYTADVQRLRAFSSATAAKLAPLGHLYWKGHQIILNRDVTRAVVDAARVGSVLITGEPGAGKSGVLLEAYRQLKAEDGDVLMIAVDKINAGSLGELQMELGLQHPIVDVLQHWPDAPHLTLLIDAMDAAKADERVVTLRDLIEAVRREVPRWHVAASMRRFDLRYSLRLQALFKGTPPSEWQLGEFQRLRHVDIPLLTDKEWQQLLDEIPVLEILTRSAPAGLLTLLRSPFNVRLVIEILSDDRQPDRLNAVETQAQLLDEYWRARVTPDGQSAYPREAQLEQVVQLAVQRRSMQVLRSQLSPATPDQTTIAALIADGILTEWQPATGGRSDSRELAFTHHLLFDEAAARLFFTERVLINQLPQDRELSIAYRPSIERRLQMAWDADPTRQEFWNLAVVLKLTPGIPEIARFLPPLVAVQLAKQLKDFTPLIRMLAGSHSAEAITLLHMIVGSLMTGREEVNPRLALWGELAEQLSELPSPPELNEVMRRLLAVLTEAGRERSIIDHALGRAARHYLADRLEASDSSEVALSVAIEAVINTAETDLAAALAVLALALEPAQLEARGYQLIPRLAHYGKRLLVLNPAFVLTLFDTAFSWEETSEERTSVGSSVLVPLRSTRKQDYSMGRYSLSELFPDLLQTNLTSATESLMRALTSSARAERKELHLVPFSFLGYEAQVGEIREWDDEPFPQPYTAEQLFLDDFRTFVQELGATDDLTRWQQVLIALARENRRPFVWRTLFRWAVDMPPRFQRELLPLLDSPEILAGWTTRDTVGDFLHAVYSDLTAPERRRIEATILGLTSQPHESEDIVKRSRDQLLGCLPAELLELQEARKMRGDLEQAEELPPNIPVIDIRNLHEEESSPYTVSVENLSEEQKDSEIVRQYIFEYREKGINLDAAGAVQPAFERLYLLKAGHWTSGDRNSAALTIWNRLVEAAEITARLAHDVPHNDSVLRLSREVLLEAVNDPLPNPEVSQFDQHGSWGSPAPRVEAAAGLSYLLGTQPDDSVVKSAFLGLIEDAAPEVRNNAAYSTRFWSRALPGAYWEILEQRIAAEPSRRVLNSWVASMSSLLQSDTQRVVTTVQTILSQKEAQPLPAKKHDDLLDRTAILIANCGFYLDNKSALDMLEVWSSDVMAPYLNNAIWRASQLLGDETTTDTQRRRALAFLQSATQTMSNAWSESVTEPMLNSDLVNRLADLASWIAIRLLNDIAGLKSAETRPSPTLARYERMQPIIDGLIPVALPQVVHHLLEALAPFVPFSPLPILLQVGRILSAGGQYGYQYDQHITDEIVNLIKLYLADHAAALRSTPEAMSTLIDILDTLINTGKVDAISLAMEIYTLYR